VLDTLNVYFTAYGSQVMNWVGGTKDDLFGFIGAHPWASFEAAVVVSIFLLTGPALTRRSR
jgi:hypothetical protein